MLKQSQTAVPGMRHMTDNVLAFANENRITELVAEQNGTDSEPANNRGRYCEHNQR